MDVGLLVGLGLYVCLCGSIARFGLSCQVTKISNRSTNGWNVEIAAVGHVPLLWSSWVNGRIELCTLSSRLALLGHVPNLLLSRPY